MPTNSDNKKSITARTQNGGNTPGGRRVEARPAEIHCELDDDLLRVRLQFELVMSNCFPIREALYRALREHRPRQVDIDLSAVPYADSSALGMLLEIQRAIKQMNGELRLLNLTPTLRDVMEVMALDTVFTIQNSK